MARSTASTFEMFISILFRMSVFRVCRTGERIQGGSQFARDASVWEGVNRLPSPGSRGTVWPEASTELGLVRYETGVSGARTRATDHPSPF